MAENYKTIHKDLEINLETLKAFGGYADYIHLHDERISIRLIVKPKKQLNIQSNDCQISFNPPQ